MSCSWWFLIIHLLRQCLKRRSFTRNTFHLVMKLTQLWFVLFLQGLTPFVRGVVKGLDLLAFEVIRSHIALGLCRSRILFHCARFLLAFAILGSILKLGLFVEGWVVAQFQSCPQALLHLLWRRWSHGLLVCETSFGCVWIARLPLVQGRLSTESSAFQLGRIWTG